MVHLFSTSVATQTTMQQKLGFEPVSGFCEQLQDLQRPHKEDAANYIDFPCLLIVSLSMIPKQLLKLPV